MEKRMGEDDKPRWTREAQDAAEAEHPPPKQPVEEPWYRPKASPRRILTEIVITVAILMGALWLVGWILHRIDPYWF